VRVSAARESRQREGHRLTPSTLSSPKWNGCLGRSTSRQPVALDRGDEDLADLHPTRGAPLPNIASSPWLSSPCKYPPAGTPPTAKRPMGGIAVRDRSSLLLELRHAVPDSDLDQHCRGVLVDGASRVGLGPRPGESVQRGRAVLPKIS
jgi:hypothetical protein